MHLGTYLRSAGLGIAKTLDFSGVYTVSREPDLYSRVTPQTVGDRTYHWVYDRLGRLTHYTPPTGGFSDREAPESAVH